MKKIIIFVCTFLMTVIMVVPAFAVSQTIAKPIISLVRNYEDGIHISWEAVDDADEYHLYRSENDGEYLLKAKTADTAYIDADVSESIKYSYKLKAVNTSNETTSAFSGKKSTYRIGATDIILIENQTKGIKISWKKVPGATGYKIYRKAENEEKYKLVSTKAGADNTSFVNTSVQTGICYSYMVKPFITPITSNYYNYHDNSVQIVRLPKITEVSAEVLGEKVLVKWTPVANVQGYIISQKNISTGKAKNYYVYGADCSEKSIRKTKAGIYSYTVRAFVEEYTGPFSTKNVVTVNDISAFLGKWYIQGTGVLAEMTINYDGTIDMHYPNYSIGDMTVTYDVLDNGKKLYIFERIFYIDDNGNMINEPVGNEMWHLYSKIPNIMGDWRSEDSFTGNEGDYIRMDVGDPTGVGYEYRRDFDFTPEGKITFPEDSPCIILGSADEYFYDKVSDTIIAKYSDGTEKVLYRWTDTSLQ